MHNDTASRVLIPFVKTWILLAFSHIPFDKTGILLSYSDDLLWPCYRHIFICIYKYVPLIQYLKVKRHGDHDIGFHDILYDSIFESFSISLTARNILINRHALCLICCFVININMLMQKHVSKPLPYCVNKYVKTDSKMH